MLQLNPISAEELVNTKNLTQIFPMVSEYLTSGKWGETYFQPEYEWFYITDNSYEDPVSQRTWLAIICVTDEANLTFQGEMHLSVLEVAKPIIGMGIGTEVVDRLIDIAMECHYSCITLQIRNPKLKGFYERFGFKCDIINNVPLFILKI